ncbi:MAG: hypothetical protein CMM39_04995 [Rhodospirillaceae bacterium]|nr:hypothetical protein [Rhodospirillaceae bacterium]
MLDKFYRKNGFFKDKVFRVETIFFIVLCIMGFSILPFFYEAFLFQQIWSAICSPFINAID